MVSIRSIIAQAVLPCNECIYGDQIYLDKLEIKCKKANVTLLKIEYHLDLASEYGCYEKGAVLDGTKVKKDYLDFESNLVHHWNNLVSRIPGLSAVIKISLERRKHLKARYADKHFRKNIFRAIDMIEKSKFLRGESGKQWKADFDFLTKNGTNYIKILEGKYKDYEDNKPKRGINRFMHNNG